MRNLKRRGVVLLTFIGLLALSGLASAQLGEEEEPEDTMFNFGYDEKFHLLVWNTSPSNGPNDCTLENRAVNPSYLTETGSILVDGLTREGTDVTFPDREVETADPLPYSSDNDCKLHAAEIAGPNGQINHGMFMKLFNSLYEGQGRGCLNRYLAQSDLGKGDQHIRVSDDDPDFVPVVDEDTGEIVFSTFAADCERGKNGNGNGPEAASNRDGRPDSPGKSGDAPGRNK